MFGFLLYLKVNHNHVYLQILETAFSSVLVENGYILSREPLTFDPTIIVTQNGVQILTIHTTCSEKLVLFTKRNQQEEPPLLIDLKNSSQQFEWLATLQKALKKEQHVLLYSQDDPLSGILGLTKCIRKEMRGEQTRCFVIQDKAPKFDLQSEFYHEHLKKGFAINVYKNKTWGTYRHLLLKETEEVKGEHWLVEATTRGDLSSLKWVEGYIQSKNGLGLTNELIYVSIRCNVTEHCIQSICLFRVINKMLDRVIQV